MRPPSLYSHCWHTNSLAPCLLHYPPPLSDRTCWGGQSYSFLVPATETHPLGSAHISIINYPKRKQQLTIYPVSNDGEKPSQRPLGPSPGTLTLCDRGAAGRERRHQKELKSARLRPRGVRKRGGRPEAPEVAQVSIMAAVVGERR